MPLRVPIPPALQADRFNFGAGQSLDYNGMVAHIEQLMAQGDVLTVMGRAMDLANALQAAVNAGAINEGDPFWNDVQAFLAAVSQWTNQRTAAGAGGRGVVVVEPSADVSPFDITAGDATVASSEWSRVSDIYGSLRAGDLLSGETVADAVARIYAATYGHAPSDAAMAQLPNVARTRPVADAGGVVPQVIYDPSQDADYVPFTPTPPTGGGGAAPTDEIPTDGAPPPSARGGVSALVIGAAALALFLLSRKKR